MATTRVKAGAIEVQGLDELNRALRDMGPEFPRQMRVVNKKIATFVADTARSGAYSIGGVAAKVAPSIKMSAGAKSAGVALGGSAYPMAGGAEFGAIRYKQFQSFRGSGSSAGYFVYPAIRRDSARIEDEYGEAVEDLIKRVGLA